MYQRLVPRSMKARIAELSVASTSPTAISRRGPMLRYIRLVGWAIIITPIAIGNVVRPDSNGESPRSRCSRNGRRKSAPENPIIATNCVVVHCRKSRFLNSRTSIIGSAVRSSARTNATRIAMPAARNSSTRLSPNPREPTSASAYWTHAIPAAARTNPRASNLPGLGLLLLFQEPPGNEQPKDPHRHVHQEDPLPVHVLHEEAAQDRSARRRNRRWDDHEAGGLRTL